MPRTGSVILACGAIAHELVAVKRQLGWQDLKIQCLPAELHNHPQQIPARLEAKIITAIAQFEHVLIGYADCGTGGHIDRLAKKYDLQRLPGAHCYEFFAGHEAFTALSEANLGTFYLTDFLARHFQRLMIHGFKLDKHPELKAMFFSNYSLMVYLAQTDNPARRKDAQAAADWLDLPLQVLQTGYGQLAQSVITFKEVQR